jgi:GT2 family glycosyltransferase
MQLSRAKLGRTAWQFPRRRADGERASVGIVVANFNTYALIAGLVFSLYRLLGRGEFSQLVIVDNASRDGSRELLSAFERAGLITLILNSRQRYHGRGCPDRRGTLAAASGVDG